VRADRRSRSSRRVGKNGKWMWVEKKKEKGKRRWNVVKEVAR
jgi:hypothetical protein